MGSIRALSGNGRNAFANFDLQSSSRRVTNNSVEYHQPNASISRLGHLQTSHLGSRQNVQPCSSRLLDYQILEGPQGPISWSNTANYVVRFP